MDFGVQVVDVHVNLLDCTRASQLNDTRYLSILYAELAYTPITPRRLPGDEELSDGISESSSQSGPNRCLPHLTKPARIANSCCRTAEGQDVLIKNTANEQADKRPAYFTTLEAESTMSAGAGQGRVGGAVDMMLVRCWVA